MGHVLRTIAIHGYRSLQDLVLPLAPVTVITGANGAGKSSLYRSLRLLAGCATGDLIGQLARDGGLDKVLWAGPEEISGAMRRGEVPVEGGARRRKPVSLMLGFTTEDVGYLIDLGLPVPNGQTVFGRDAQIKREEFFAPPVLRPASRLAVRRNGRVTIHEADGPRDVLADLSERLSVLSELADPHEYPEILAVRQQVRQWRFYDSFRTDTHSPARQPCLGTWTPVLAEDGADLAAAVQTILESKYAQPLADAVAAAFPGGRLGVRTEGPFELEFTQHGLLRPLTADELSDGTLRFLLLATALLSPRPPNLLVLNEPETSLHPDVLPVLAELIIRVAQRTQVIVVSHSRHIIDALAGTDESQVRHHHLVKELAATRIEDQGLLTTPRWEWGSR